MTLISDGQLKQFREDGYFLTEPVFNPDSLDEFSRETDRLHRQFIEEAELAGDATSLELARLRPFIGGAHGKSDFIREFVKAPIYLEACRHLIGADADLYFNQVVTKPPAQGKQFGWHQDSGYVITEPLEYITCWTAISRTFVDNGCIWIVPGSHKWGLQPHVFSEELREFQVAVDETNAIPVEMQAGQVAIFSSLMLHKSGPNVSSEVRRGFVPQYHVPGAFWPHNGEPAGDHVPVLRDSSRVD